MKQNNTKTIEKISTIIWEKKLTLVVGFRVCILLHLGLVFPFAGHVWHVRPTSHVPQVSPICYLVLGQKNQTQKKEEDCLQILEILKKLIIHNWELPWSWMNRWRDTKRLTQRYEFVNYECECP